MAVLIACPTCQRKLRLTENMLGRQIRCPACNTTFPAGDTPGETPAADLFDAAATAGGLGPLFDYLTFRRMVTPLVIQVLFWLGVVFCAFFGTALIVSGLTHRLFVDWTTVLVGVVLVLLGPVLLRISCEATMVFFRIHETLTELKDRLNPPR
jgi:hypothetical protein